MELKFIKQWEVQIKGIKFTTSHNSPRTLQWALIKEIRKSIQYQETNTNRTIMSNRIYRKTTM